MEKKDFKKTWETPELIVLVRSQPAEVVLTNCKLTSLATSVASAVDGCDTTGCAFCNDIAFS